MNQKRFRSIAVIVLIILVAGTVGYFVLRKPVATTITEPSPATQVISLTATENQTSKVQTTETETLKDGVYDNHKYGFQFQMPNNWEFTQFGIQSPDLNINLSDLGFEETSYYEWKQGAVIRVYVSQIEQNIKELQKFNTYGRGGPYWVSEKVIKVAGEDALIYEYIYPDGGSRLDILEFAHNNNLKIQIYIQYNGLYLDGQKIFNNILSTFKFTK